MISKWLPLCTSFCNGKFFIFKRFEVIHQFNCITIFCWSKIQLNSEWSEVELICLQNDLNNGLGFGLLGNKTAGVLVRNIVPGGSADLVCLTIK